MKHVSKLFLFALLILSFNACSQSQVDYRPSFSAIIVKNIESSTQWYQSLFGLQLKNKANDDAAGYKVTILESSVLTLELLELKGSIPSKNVTEGKPQGTQVQGHFKIGFQVSDMNACIKHLEGLNIKIPQIWTDPNSKKRNFIIQDPDGNLIQFFEG